MKVHATLLPAMIVALGLPGVAHAKTEKLTEAQITRIVNDVKTIDPGKHPQAAIIKEVVKGEQSVRTGIDSRTELLFNDKTITRLGANAHFSFSEGTRNMELESGVMLLQVPKNIGGAKIETAAVTAGITGTTILLEAGKDYTKLIVLEGECCLVPKNGAQAGGFFQFKKKVCASAGEEIVVRNGAKKIPAPVYVSLKLIEKTSLLLRGRWGAPLNEGPIIAAANGQAPDRPSTDISTAGAGTDVTVTRGKLPNNPPPPPPPPRIVPTLPPTRPQ